MFIVVPAYKRQDPATGRLDALEASMGIVWAVTCRCETASGLGIVIAHPWTAVGGFNPHSGECRS